MSSKISPVVLVFVFSFLPFGLARASGETVDLLVLHGRVLDGAGNPWVQQDIGITGDEIVFVGNASGRGIVGRESLDVSGLLIVPGFWDVHSHANLNERHGREALPLLYQGVTTLVKGVDGGGSNEVAEIFDQYERDGLAVNALQFVGHGAARTAVMGADFGRPARPDEIERMKAYVARGMEQGAVGFSTGLAYNPGYYATTDEVVALAEVAARYGGVYDTHDRDMGVTYEGIGYLASVKEAIEIAERAGTPLIFSHFNALGERAHRLVPEGVRLIEEARTRGVNVMAAQHVYTASQSHLLGHVVPRWVQVGGEDEMRRRLEDPELQERIDAEIDELLSWRGGPAKIVLTTPERGLNGRSVAELARRWGITPAAAVRRAILEAGPHVGDMNVDIYSMENIRMLAERDWMMTCTDGWTFPRREGATHPRSYGTFTRKLRRLVYEEKVLSLPFAIRGMTSLAAQFFGVHDRGLIKPGFFADIVVLDEANIHDRATYEEPHRYSEGTVHVLVNGTFVFRDGEPTGLLPGRPIPRGGGR